MGGLDDHAGVEAGGHVAAGGLVAVFDLVIERDSQCVSCGKSIRVERVSVFNGEIRHRVTVNHFLRGGSDGDVALLYGQISEVVYDGVVIRDDGTVFIIDGGDGCDGVRVFAEHDVV